MDAGPAALAQCLVITMKLAPAITQHQAALCYNMQTAIRGDAILQGHFLRGPEL